MSPSIDHAAEKREFAQEIKCLISPAKAAEIQTWSRQHLRPDPNAAAGEDAYVVSSLYYDTSDLAIYHRQSWLRHSKFRVRRYGGAHIFLERKLKVGNHVAKRRAALGPVDPAAVEAWPEMVSWFAQKTRARRLQPVCQIDCERTARVLLTAAGPIRLTLDRQVFARTADRPVFDLRTPRVSVTGDVILELKFRRDLPVLFRELVATFNLNPAPFSKYRTAVQKLGLVPSVGVAGAVVNGLGPEVAAGERLVAG